MRALRLRALLVAPVLFSFACVATHHVSVEEDRAETLARWMTGSFSSADQAREDPRFFDISLVMVPIWTGREDGPWLYVEQAVAAAAERPYRQRVYRLVELEGGVRSEVYELPGDPMDFAGAWRTPATFDALGPADLTERDGCAIHLTGDARGYTGATHERDCASSLRGASYATSEVFVSDGLVASWDRGWDRSGEQVWGAVSGPYLFLRQ